MFLSDEVFRSVVASTPLVSIDLVVRRPNGDLLLGQRLNRPARGFWFVPGGRIYKNETLDAAFRRITEAELGVAFERDQARLLDVYEHFYADSVFGPAGAGQPDTHYVVLGYRLDIPDPQRLALPTAQHDAYRWWAPGDICGNPVVHENSQAYLAALGWPSTG